MNKDEVKEICESALIYLTMRFPTFAELIIKLGGYTIVNEPEMMACAWTDGKKITINEAHVIRRNTDKTRKLPNGEVVNTNITSKEMAFIFCHELFHIIGLTYERGKHVGLDPNSPELTAGGIVEHNRRVKEDLWNDATDYEINALLVHNRSDTESNPVGQMPEGAYYKREYKDMTAEEIYRILLKEAEANATEVLMASKDGKGSISSKDNSEDKEGQGNKGDDKQDTSNVDGSNKDDGKGQGNGGKGTKNDSKNTGKQLVKPEGIDEYLTIDKHLPMDQETLEDVAARINEYKGSILNGQSNNSAIDRLLKEAFKEVPFNWRKALSKYITSYIKSNYTWNKQSRAGIATHTILPAAGKTPYLKVACAVDTSGSISDKELTAMTDHLFTILHQFKGFSIDLWSCGSRVYEETFTTITETTKNRLKCFKYKSDGGNDMRENFKFIKEHYKHQKPDVLIILSDFYDPLDGDKETTSPCNVIFLCIDHKDFVKPAKIKGEVYPFHVHDK